MTQPTPPRHLPPGPNRGNAPPAPKGLPAQPPQAGGQKQPPPAPAYLSTHVPTPVATPAPTQAPIEVRDPVFFHHAVAMLSAALLTPNGLTEEGDEKHALSTAEMIARFLDTGTIPDGYITPANQALISMSLYYEHKKADGSLIPTNEGERLQRHAQLVKHVTEMKIGDVKNVDTIKRENSDMLAALSDLSEPVRAVALQTTVLRLTALGKTITGAHPNEAMGIAVHELLRSIRLAEKYGVPVNGIETVAAQKDAGLIDDEVAKRACPYPGSVGLDMSIRTLMAVVDEAHAQQAQAEGQEDAAGEPAHEGE